MEVIPAIDVLGDGAVRLYQGDYARVTGFGEPAELAARFAAAGAGTIHLVDLDGAKTGRVRPELVRSLTGFARIQASGGVRSLADAHALVEAGASRVVVGTAAFGGGLDEFARALGAKLVVALDVRDGIVRTAGWTESSLRLDDAIDLCGAAGVERLLCTAIVRDGTLAGPDVELVARVVERSRVPVLAAGGIRSQADVDALARAGAEGAIVGRALLEGSLCLRQEPDDAQGR
ncbi:MAG: 1-(5-phosphoribosyl)-5-[(5-phosphoribosylamino)methylideneamino]imidazole-4-carboxamide isomerase [Gaiellaceae bacterium]